MKQGWKLITLGDACLKGSSNISQNKLDKETGIYPIYGASGFIKYVSFFHNDRPYLSIVKDGSGFGRVTKMYARTSVIGTLQYIYPKDGIDLNYLYYSLISIDFKKYVTGAAIPHIYFKDYKNEPFLLMPLSEQQQIVSILDKAFAAIDKVKANAEQNLKNAKELFESYLQNIFSNNSEHWEKKKLKEILTKTELIDPTKTPNKEFIYLDVSSVNKDTKEIDKPAMLLGKDAPSRARKLIRVGDVIFATVRPTHSRVALISEEFNEQVCSTGYFILRASELLNNNLVFYFLLTKSFNEQMEKLQKGASYPAVNDNDVKSIFMPFPKSLKEQQRIVFKLDKLRAETQKLEAFYQKNINNLEELKKSILQKAFAGELNSSAQINLALSNVIPLQKIYGITPTDLQAGIIAFAFQKHIEENQQHKFHRVKVEKIVHLVENILNVDLDRNPIKDAAGPNDFAHAIKVESRARKANYYSVFKNGDYYNYQLGNNINTVAQKARTCLGEKFDTLSELLNILVPMKTYQTEIVATVYAAWNNLIIIGNKFTDEDIVTEARENWHEEKLKIPREKFLKAIDWMRTQELLIPKGNGKIVATK